MSSNNPHPIFVQARKNSKINPQDLLSILWDSAADHKSFSDYLTKFIQNDLSTPPLFTERSRKDQYQRVIENSPKLLKTMDVDFGLKMPPDPYLNDVTPIIGGVGLGMNLPLLYLCGTEEQKQKWIPRIQNGDILSAYGQTEIGHGSDVQSLETTATYDENKEIFVINSPSVSAYKFWPGDLGKNSNWVVVYARVITKGQFRGVYPLFFQIRDMDTHKLFDGVDGGDIGPKLGYNFKENGFLGFQNFKVPREALLAKFVSVERDGTFKVHGNQKILYGSMMLIRTNIVLTMSKVVCIAVLIAQRYSMIRTQFKGPKGIERPIIDYKLQRAKIYPNLAKAYACHFGALGLKRAVQANDANIKKMDFSLMKEVHIGLSVFKAMFTWWGVDCLFTCMQACGGHGYLESSGFPMELHKLFPAVIYEGVNTVLLVQVGNELSKTYNNFKTGTLNNKEVLDSLSYFNNLQKYQNKDFKISSSKIRDPNSYTEMFAKGVIYNIEKASKVKANLVTKKQMSKKNAEDTGTGLIMEDASKMHGIHLVLRYFNERLSSLSEGPVKKALSKLCLIFAIDMMNTMSSHLFESGVIGSQFVSDSRKVYEELIDDINEDSLVLAEGFGFPELYIEKKSALGNENGKVYENLMGMAMDFGMLNKIDVHPTMLNYIAEQKKIQDERPKL